jgi:hypothetical protein
VHGQPEAFQQRAQAVGIRGRRHRQRGRQPRGEHHADCDRFAVVAAAVALFAFDGVAKVWPKLSSARSPRSNGSRSTIAALCPQLRAIASASAVSSTQAAPSHWRRANPGTLHRRSRRT